LPPERHLELQRFIELKGHFFSTVIGGGHEDGRKQWRASRTTPEEEEKDQPIETSGR
jgi:hypothetical protein